MGVHSLGPKKLRRISQIVGQPVYRAYAFSGEHYVAMCWVDREHSCRVNYKTGEILSPITRTMIGGLPLTGWDNGAQPPDPHIATAHS